MNKRYGFRYVYLLGAFVIYSLVGVLAKLAATSETLLEFLAFLGLEIFVLGIYALIWQQLLKKFSLITAMSCRGIVVILSLIWAVVIFRESITIFHIVGSVLIVLGIYVVSSDETKCVEAENDN